MCITECLFSSDYGSNNIRCSILIIIIMVVLASTLFVIVISAILRWFYIVHVQRQKLQWMPGETGTPFFGIVGEVKDNTGKSNTTSTFFTSSQDEFLQGFVCKEHSVTFF